MEKSPRLITLRPACQDRVTAPPCQEPRQAGAVGGTNM